MSSPRRALCAIICACIVLAIPAPARSAASAFLAGTVASADGPVSGAVVTANGDGVFLTTRTDAAGHFRFPGLASGSYVLTVESQAGSLTSIVDLPAAGVVVRLDVAPKRLGIVSANAAAPAKRSGTDVTLNRAELTRSPAAGGFAGLLAQLPGAARGANGVMHINGDHGDINYVVDGVSIPQELNRDIGSEFDSNDAAFVDVLEGAYPARYGERFASVLIINTRGAATSRGFAGGIDAGSSGLVDTSARYQTALGRGSIAGALRDSVTSRGLDPPNPGSPHDVSSDANQFLRVTEPRGRDYLNLTVSHAHQTFQLPVDLIGGEPAATNDDESQDDLFAALQERHAIADRGSLAYGLGYKRSRIADAGDLANDWAYGEALNLAAGGSSADCADALSPGVSFSTSSCGYSLSGARTATDLKLNVDSALTSSAVHQIGWGAGYDSTAVTKNYTVTLQPGNFLAPIFTPATPGAPYAVVDTAPNNGFNEAMYIEDAWRMGSAYELDYGLRFDAFQLRSTGFARGFVQTSPRVKLTRILGMRSSAYAYYGRFFTPFSFENVSPAAAALLDLPLSRSPAAFDLKPQRDSDYEVGGRLPLGSGDLGWRIAQRDATDLIDDTQVGVTLLHQDINYALGRIGTQTLAYQREMTAGGQFYVTANHTYSVDKGCETQLLAPCFGSPADWTPADHEQRWGATTGVLLDDGRGGWFSVDGEYGSGLSSAACPPSTPGFCKYTPHVTFDIEKGVALSAGAKLTVRIRNVLNDEYRVTYLNAQGNHWAAPRSFDVGIAFGAR